METIYQTAEDLKKIMSSLPVPLTIVTAESLGKKRGVTISSFTSLSMNPPLVTFNIDCKTQFCSIIRHTEHFAVHFPSHQHERLCKRFATSGLTEQEQFKDIDFFENEYGVPVFKDISSVIFCQKVDEIKVEDHLIFVGKVTEVYHSEDSPNLLYHKKLFKHI